MNKFLVLAILANILATTTCYKVCRGKNASTGPRCTTKEEPTVQTDLSSTNSELMATISSGTPTCKNTCRNNCGMTTNENDASEGGWTTEMTTTNDTCNSADLLDQFRADVVEFGFKFVYEVKKANADAQAIICAPLATIYLLGGLTCYSRGNTNRELLEVFRLKNCEQIRCAILQADEFLRENKRALNLSLSGSYIFARQELPFTDAFKRFVDYVLIGHTLNVDVRNPNAAVRTINNKVEQETRISSFVSTDIVNKTTQIILGTSLSFTKIFKYGFDIKNNFTGPFYISPNKSVMVEYLSQTQVMNYTESEDIDSQVVIVPLEQEYVMMAVLPNPTTNLNRVMKQLQNYDTYESVCRSLKMTNVTFIIPSLANINTSFDSKTIVEKITPVRAIYDENEAQFTNMIENDRAAYVTAHIQTVVMTTNFTGICPTPQTNDETVPCAKMFCQRPYMYIIMIRGVPFFIGATLQ